MKTIFLLGKACTGKDRAAKLLIKKIDVTACINGRQLTGNRDMIYNKFSRALKNIPANTDILYINDLSKNHFNLIKELFFNDHFVLAYPGTVSIKIYPKLIIVTCECDYEDLILQEKDFNNFIFYTCMQNRDHEIVMKLHHPKEIDQVFN